MHLSLKETGAQCKKSLMRWVLRAAMQHVSSYYTIAIRTFFTWLMFDAELHYKSLGISHCQSINSQF